MSSSFPHYASYTSSLLATSPSHRSNLPSDLEALKARGNNRPPPPRLSHGAHGEGSSSSLSASQYGRGRRSVDEDRSFVLDEESLLFPDTSPVRDSAAAAPGGRTISTPRYGSTLEGRRASHGASSNEVGARGRFRKEAPHLNSIPNTPTDPSPALSSPTTTDYDNDDLRGFSSESTAGESGLTIRGRRPSALPRVLEPLILLAEQGGETAEEEEERVLGAPGGGDLTGESHRDWKAAVRAEAKILIYTTVPILFTQAAEYSLILASVISIGHLSVGPTDLAASSLASMTASVTAFSVIQGIASSLDSLLPAAWTSDDPTKVGLWAQRVSIIVAMACVPMYYAWFQAETILLLLRQDPIVAQKAALYLRYLSIGIPGYAGNSIAKKYFQAQGLMNVPTVVIFIVAPFNIFLNWLLVYGPIDALRLGFRGAPLATGLSMNLEFALFLIYGRLWSDSAAWPGLNFKKAFKDLGTVAVLGLSGIGMVASEWWSWEIVTLAASMLGAMALATQSILLISCSITYQIPFSLSIATAVRSGNLLGAGRGWEAKWTAWVALGLSVLISVFNSTILLIVRQRWALLFNEDEEVRLEVARILPYVAFFQLADGLTGVAGGILRVVGKQTLGAALNLSSYYVLGLPVGIYLCFEKHFGIRGLWIGLSIALCYSSVLCNYIVFRTDWDREVLRAQDRLGLGGGKEEEERRPLLLNEEITEEEEEEAVAQVGREEEEEGSLFQHTIIA